MNLENCTLVELRQLAKDKGVKNVSKLKREELISILEENDRTMDVENGSDSVNIEKADVGTHESDTENYRSEKAYSNEEDIYEDYDDDKTNEDSKSEINEAEVRYVDGYKLTSPDDKIAEGILEILPDGYGFLRGKNYLSTPDDIYISRPGTCRTCP